MENNKLLIGVRFVPNDGSEKACLNLELEVLKDMKLYHLLEGIVYGIRKLPLYEEISRDYQNVPAQTDQVEKAVDELVNNSHLESYVYADKDNKSARCFSKENGDLDKSLSDLGFISSSVIVFTNEPESGPKTKTIDRGRITSAFAADINEKNGQRIAFPEYNISSRDLITFDSSPITLLPAGEPPQFSRTATLNVILPSLVSTVLLIGLRTFSYTQSADSAYLIMASIFTALSGVILSAVRLFQQKRIYKNSLECWKKNYEKYISAKIKDIRDRQKMYHDWLSQRYPLIEEKYGDANAKFIDKEVFSRQPQDNDFLLVRLGGSTQVETPFQIVGEKKDEIKSSAFFRWNEDGVKIVLPEEISRNDLKIEPLISLPQVLANEFQYIRLEVPTETTAFVYSLHDKGAIGICASPDFKYEKFKEDSSKLIDLILLDLCYHQSPENLQIILLFDRCEINADIDKKIKNYKFMPHFHGLFDDMSQFVFDQESANQIYGRMYKLMSDRAEKAKVNEDDKSNSENIHNESIGGTNICTPYVLFVIMEGEDYGLREHTFAEYLPSPPLEGKEYVNSLGITFIYSVYYREYLPKYCNSILQFGTRSVKDTEQEITEIAIVPHNYVCEKDLGSGVAFKKFEMQQGKDSDREDAFRFLSALYYSKIAEYRRVPSLVSFFDLWSDN